MLNLQGMYKSNCQMNTHRSLSSSNMIEGVLTKLLECKWVSCMRDAKGLTPLLIAAQRGSFSGLKHILENCPQSAEVCDLKGKTVLHHLKSRIIIPFKRKLYARDHDRDSDHNQQHEEPKTAQELQSICYWELKKLFKIPEIDAIKDAKDSDGNTPVHVALENEDFVLVKVLFECFADFTIKNKDGDSALDLIQSIPDFATKMEEVIVTEKVFSQAMDDKLLIAAKEGDLTMLRGIETDIESGKVIHSDGDCDRFFRRTSEGLSILHIAVKHGHQSFVEEAIKLFPTLVLTADSSGETPLHVAARLNKDHYPVAATLLQLSKDCTNKLKEEAGHLFLDALPWKQKNSKGDNPLHEAFRSSNYDMARALMELDSELSSSENNAGETPLHILARYSTYTKSDKIGALVTLLMQQNEHVVYKRDSHGFTPLLRASYCGRLRVAYWIIHNCPASVQFRDPKGRNFLHLLRLEPIAELDAMTVEDMLYVYTNILVLTSEAKVDGCQGPVLMPLGKYEDLRKLTGAEFDALRSSQDHQGNTPLHSALDNNNFGAAKFLLHWCLRSELMHEMSIINNKGQSVLNLLELLDNNTPYVKQLKDLASLAHKKIKEEAFGKKMMEEKVYTEAVKGNVDYFFKEKLEEQNQDNTFMCQVAPDGSNILHIAIQHNRAEFAKKVMECYPHLIWDRDYHGETPLHTAAKLWHIDYSRLQHLHFEAQWEKACRSYHDSPSEEGLLIIPPWRVKNSQGNVPLHEKVNLYSWSCEGIGDCLLRFDFEAATYVNSVGDTPLHVCAQESCSFFMLKDLDYNARSATYVRDKEGLTPLLRAAKAGNDFEIHAILQLFPELVQVRDDRGRSFLHLLRVDESSQKLTKELYNEVSTLDALRKTKDFDGNTPLHSAIQDNNSIGAKLIAERYVEDEDNRMAHCQLAILNNDGKSIMDLLASHDDAPTEVLQLLVNKSNAGANVHGLYIEGEWVRSGYGVCKSQIKDMANTLSVVAGLLATITFAAAFQVPGGFNGDSGSPILLQRVAFKAFMIFNAFAMCGSMAVLFFLLWVMLTGNVTYSFLLLDLSIAILQLSFGATLLSFTTGVYVATSHKALWLAISICGLSSTLVVLLRKNFILPIAQCFKLALHCFGECRLAGGVCKLVCKLARALLC